MDTFRLTEKEATTAKVRTYPPEFRRKILELARSGRSLSSIANEFQVARQTIMNWQKQDDLDAGRRTDGLTTEESAEMTKLRRKVRELEMERSFKSQREASIAVFEFIEGWYNPKRRHSALGYLSPNNYERRMAEAA